jgi:hypothetical protein
MRPRLARCPWPVESPAVLRQSGGGKPLGRKGYSNRRYFRRLGNRRSIVGGLLRRSSILPCPATLLRGFFAFARPHGFLSGKCETDKAALKSDGHGLAVARSLFRISRPLKGSRMYPRNRSYAEPRIARPSGVLDQ